MAGENLEQRLNASAGGSPLENTVENEEEKSDWTLGNIVRDTLLYSPIGIAAYLIGGPATFLTAAGLGVGKWLANKKKKKKTTWADMRKTLGIGMVGGALAYWAYALPDFIMGTPVSLLGKVAKTVLFNPLIVSTWIGWYRTTNYITEKYGGQGLVKSFFNGKIFRYVKEAYNEDLKKKLPSNILETFLTLAPIHFMSMNYVSNVTARVGIGAVNDVLFSLIAGEEGLLKTIKNKFTGKKKADSYNPNTTPYQQPQNQYRPAA